MSKLVAVCRLLLGLPFLVFGLNGFFEFLPQPEPETPEAGAFIQALVASNYLMPLLKVTEIVCGILLVTGRLVPLALTVLAPILINIVGFHLALAPGSSAMALGLVALELICVWAYRAQFRGVLSVNARPFNRAF